MQNDNIENIAVETYTKNMNFLEKIDKELFEKIKLFELGIELEKISSKHELEYKDGYFDILDKENETFYYGENSLKYSTNRVKNVNFNAKTNSFRTFYDMSYEEKTGKNAKNFSIYSSYAYGNAPVINYINNHLPPEQIMKNMFIYIVFGTGLGLHLPKIDKKVNARLYLIIEPSLEIFRLSLFVTDYVELAQNKIVCFSVSEIGNIFEEKFADLFKKYHSYNHYIKFFLFSQNCQSYISNIQTVLVSQSSNLYSYDRSLQSLKRTYDFASANFNFINVSDKYNFEAFNDKPILFLAAGPSVQKEIDFVVKNQNKFVIVSINSMLTFLESYKIVPSIIIQYDESSIVMNQTIHKIKDKSFFSDTLFFFSSHICTELMNTFPKDNIYVYNALFEAKKGFSHIVSPSVGEISYHILLKLGVNHLYFLGLDMSYDPDSGKSHHDGYHEQIGAKNNAGEESLGNFNLRKNVLKMKGNFVDEVESLAVFKISIHHVNHYTREYKKIRNLKLFNLSNGVYFDDMLPLKTKDINIEKREDIDKNLFRKELVESLSDISSNNFSEVDREYNKEKLEDAYRLQQKFDSLIVGVKYSNSEKFLELLTSYREELFSEYKCHDLQSIIKNYSEHNFAYIFYFMNLKHISNPKKHIKHLLGAFSGQIRKIIDAYIDILKKSLD